MAKESIERYFLLDGNVLQFSSKDDLEKWVQNYLDENPGKGLGLPEGTKRTMIILGNEVSIKTEVVTATKEIEVHTLKVEVGTRLV